MSKWTAAEISDYDQFLAGADAEVDLLVQTLQISMAEVGERQAMANVYILVSQRNPAGLAALLMASLRRLAGGEE